MLMRGLDNGVSFDTPKKKDSIPSIIPDKVIIQQNEEIIFLLNEILKELKGIK